MKTVYTTLLMLACMASSFSAYAVEFYAGVNMGQSHFTMDSIDAPQIALVKMPLESETDTFTSLTLGYVLTEALSVELGYNDFGTYESRGEFDVTGPEVEDNTWDISVDLSSLSLSAASKLMVTDNFSLKGKFGFQFWESDVTVGKIGQPYVMSTPQSIKSEAHTDPYFALGASYRFDLGLDVNFEYQMMDLQKYDTDVATLGVSYAFSF